MKNCFCMEQKLKLVTVRDGFPLVFAEDYLLFCKPERVKLQLKPRDLNQEHSSCFHAVFA